MKKLMLATGVAALLVLAGCGGSDNNSISNNGGNSGGGGTTTPPVSMLDTFYSVVLTLVGDGAETTTEPMASDTLVASSPENTEPASVK